MLCLNVEVDWQLLQCLSSWLLRAQDWKNYLYSQHFSVCVHLPSLDLTLIGQHTLQYINSSRLWLIFTTQSFWSASVSYNKRSHRWNCRGLNLGHLNLELGISHTRCINSSMDYQKLLYMYTATDGSDHKVQTYEWMPDTIWCHISAIQYKNNGLFHTKYSTTITVIEPNRSFSCMTIVCYKGSPNNEIT
jgi:hypothetical protein